MGCLSPVGNDVASAWDAICNGRSGIGPLEAFDPERFPAKIAGEIRDFDVTEYLSPKEARKCDTFIHYGMAAAMQAIADAGLTDSEDDAERIGLAIGSGIGGISTIEQTYKTYLDSGPRRISPFFVPGVIINMIAGNLSIK
jgi:3-oxoacyl-[acyl-carrier-protein] synthase II